MGIRDVWAALRNDTEWQFVEYGPSMARVLGMSVEDLFRSQPHLRTVVDFLQRNIAQLGLHSFQRVSETDRQRLRDDPIALLLGRPNNHQTTYELVEALIGDLALYGEAFWWVTESAEAPSGWSIETMSPGWVIARGGGSVFTVDWVKFANPKNGTVTKVPMEQLLWFKGWNPAEPRHASSPVEALRDILAEQIDARMFRSQMWRRGGRFGGFLTRPTGAKWDKDTREKFMRAWRSKYSDNDGPNAGGTPILEDGMEYKTNRFTAHEEEWAEGTKLSLAQCASVYQINPTMVGLLDNANFSNVEAFARLLYSGTLGPLLRMIQDRITTFLVPRITTTPGVYVEFNVAEKLKGSFEEQAAALQSSVGRPWMTANEARARMNMPSLDGDADHLVTPLNVIVGGQASALDSGSQNRNAGVVEMKATREVPVMTASIPTTLLDKGVLDETMAALVASPRKGTSTVSLKSSAPEPEVAKTVDVLKAFFRRQARVVQGKLGSKAADDWWDEERWDKELSEDLYRLSVTTATQLGRKAAESLGFDADEYDEARTLKFLRAVADTRASWINQTTKAQIDAALEDDEPDVGSVFDDAESARSGSASGALMAAVAGFALVEAGKQLVGDQASKTWETGANPRPEHASMGGETVGINESFSNGAAWPGDPVLGAEGVANCNCGVEVSF